MTSLKVKGFAVLLMILLAGCASREVVVPLVGRARYHRQPG